MQNRSTTGFYKTEMEATNDLSRMKDILKNSCFGSTNVWVQSINQDPYGKGFTIAFTY